MYYDRESWTKLADMRRKALFAEHVAEDAAFYARRRAAKAQAREAWAKQRAEDEEWNQLLAEEAAEKLAAEIKPQPVASTPEAQVSGKRSGKASKVSRVKARPKVKKIRVKTRTSTKPQGVKAPRKEKGMKVVSLRTETSVIKGVSKGLYALTASGQALMEAFDGGRQIVILNSGDSIRAIVAMSDFELMHATVCIEGKDHTLVRVRNEDILEGLSGISPEKFDTSGLTNAFKVLTRKARAQMGLRAPGTTHLELAFDEVGISQRDAKKARMRAGDWVLVSRFPQGSAQKAFHWAKLRIVKGLIGGVCLNPLAMLILGGDGDGDEYYVLKAKGRERERVDSLSLMTPYQVMRGSENPNLLTKLPERKLSDGFEDRLKELERSAIGPFTTLAYQAISLVGAKIADLYLPSLELVFDVRKLKTLGLSFLVEAARIIQEPIGSRYLLLAELANKVVRHLDGNEDVEVDAYYLDAFRELERGALITHKYAQQFVDGISGHANWAFDIAPEFAAQAFPKIEEANLLSIQDGKGGEWQGLSGCLSTLTAKKKGEETKEAKEAREKHEAKMRDGFQLAEDLFGVTNAKCRSGMTYMKGSDQSPISVRLVNIKDCPDNYMLQVVHTYPGTYGIQEKVDFSTMVWMPDEIAGVPTRSHHMLTGLVVGSRVINARATSAGVMPPIKWFIHCMEQAIAEAWGADEWMLEHQAIVIDRIHGFCKIIRSAVTEWKRYSSIARKDSEGLSFQLKAVSIEDYLDAEQLKFQINERLDGSWEFRSTKNPDKGYIVPTVKHPKYREIMGTWFKTSKFSHLISMNRVLREQLPANNIGMGWATIALINRTGLTRSECASSWDALLMDRGEEFNNSPSQSDVSVMFTPREYSRAKTVQVTGYWPLMEAIHMYNDQGWDVSLEDHSQAIFDDKEQPRVITDDRGTKGTRLVEVTLHLSRTDETKQGYAYKWMVGGAKGMAQTAFQQKVVALTAQGEVTIDAAVPGETLYKKNGLHWVLEGSNALTGIDAGEDPAEHIAANIANGADEAGQYPIYVDGNLVGNYTVLRVPYWMLPTMSEHQGTHVGDQPWVAPTSREFAPYVDRFIPQSNMVRAAQVYAAVILQHVTKHYNEKAAQGYAEGTLIQEQAKEIKRIMGDVKSITFENHEDEQETDNDDIAPSDNTVSAESSSDWMSASEYADWFNENE